MKLVIWTVKPVAVAVGVPNTGVNAGPTAARADTDADSVLYASRNELTVTEVSVYGAKPETVTTPVAEIVTRPPCVATPEKV